MTTPDETNEQGAAQPEQAPPVQPAQPEAPAAPAAPQYSAPPADGYQQPPAGGYQQPAAPGYQAPVSDPVNNIQLNYWLSVFFHWLPALIFWLIEKDKGNARATAFHVANFNFSLLRAGVMYIGWILVVIPVIGPLLWGAANIVLFVFHIMAAAKVANEYRNGGKTDPFIFNIPLVK